LAESDEEGMVVKIGSEQFFTGKGIEGIEGYALYKNEEFGFSFEYPKNWYFAGLRRPAETDIKYKGGITLLIRGPKGERVGSSLRLWVIPSKKKGGFFKTLDEYVKHSITARAFSNSNLLSDKKVIFKGSKAREILLSNQLKVPPRAVKQVLSTSMKIWIIFEHDGYFYNLKYGAGEEEYLEYLEAYERAKETFKFFQPAEVAPEVAKSVSIEPKKPQEIVIIPDERIKPIGLEKQHSFNYNRAPLRVLLQFFASLSGLKIILDEEPEGIITFREQDITIKEALDIVAREQNFTYEIKEDAIYIKKR
jgi:hypothetical protein